MKKVAGIIFAVMMIGVVLSGCYQKECCEKEQAAPKCYKGEG